MSTEFELSIDGQLLPASRGDTVLQVAERAGIAIPTLCNDPRLEPAGVCRSCLVAVDGQRRLQPACAFRAEPGMKVTTRSDRIDRHRQVLMSLYLADHVTEGVGAGALPVESANGNQLRSLAAECGPLLPLDKLHSPRVGRVDDNPYIRFDPELCILCERCTRYCDEVEAVSAITLAGRGAATTITTAFDQQLTESSCEFCGGCIDTCPTGAMAERKPIPHRPEEVRKIRSTCNFCGVGCQVDLNVVQERVVKVTSPPPGQTVNDGNLCVKGRFAYDFIHHQDRLTEPLIRDADGRLRPATWEEAIQRAADGLNAVKSRHGKDALSFISSSRCTGEENYLMQKLSRAAFGTNNCHQCAAT
jgi:predicted molibdopterin-dependent oxidoreductase YjgC